MKKILYIFLFAITFCQGQIINSYSYDSGGGGGTELLTESNAAGKDNEGNTIGSWDPSWYGSVETTDVHVGTYAYFLDSGGTYIFQDLDFTGVIGDEIVITGFVKCESQEAQELTLSGTSDNSDFLGGSGNQPTTWTAFSRTVTLTSANFHIRCTKNGGGGEAGGIWLDDVSVINNGQ